MQSENVFVTQLTYPSVQLSYHIENLTTTKFNITYGDYDFIILQNQAHPFPGEQVILEQGKEINQWIKETESKPVIFINWREKKNFKEQDIVTKVHRQLAKEINALVAPIGEIWKYMCENYPNIPIYHEDEEHASPIGSYLIACVFYATLFDKNPIGLPHLVQHKSNVIVNVPENQAKVIQEVVWKFHLEEKNQSF